MRNQKSCRVVPANATHVPAANVKKLNLRREIRAFATFNHFPPRRLPSSLVSSSLPFFHAGAALPTVCSGSASRCCCLFRQGRRPTAWATTDACANQQPVVFVLVAAQSSREVVVFALQHASCARGVHEQAYVRWAYPTLLRLSSYASQQRAGGGE